MLHELKRMFPYFFHFDGSISRDILYILHEFCQRKTLLRFSLIHFFHPFFPISLSVVFLVWYIIFFKVLIFACTFSRNCSYPLLFHRLLYPLFFLISTCPNDSLFSSFSFHFLVFWGEQFFFP